jgi:hypothetical protein
LAAEPKAASNVAIEAAATVAIWPALCERDCLFVSARMKNAMIYNFYTPLNVLCAGYFMQEFAIAKIYA